MPSIPEIRQQWDGTGTWSQEGDEWSEWWGTAHAQWVGCLLPRVFPFLKGRILEIAPGHGRWTQFLQPHSASLIGIDVAQGCIERCAERFSQYPNLEFKVNDGFTFPMIEDGSIDFAFSFDSLVHAESDVMSSYANELARVLKPRGVAFLHHSNLDAVRRRLSLLEKIKRRLSHLPPIQQHWRAPSMSAEKMRTFVEGAGMMCIQQEIVPWGTGLPQMIDCISTIINTPGNRCHVVRNPRFMEEAASVKRICFLRAERIQDGAETGKPPLLSQPPDQKT
jgi:ubiquinone/menaquinone biosynthesis C-methylase UbiE